MSDATPRTERSPARWPLAVLTALVAVVVLYLLWSSWSHGALVSWMRRAHPVPFFLVVAVLPAVGVPMTPLFVLVGATFGIRVGLVGAWLALAANLTLCYWIATSGLRPHVEWLLRRFRYELPDFKEEGRDATRFTLVVKLMPDLPGFAKHYLLGVANVPFAIYLGASMLVSGLYAAAFVIIGESLLEHDRRRAALAIVALVLVGAGVWAWRRRRSSRRADKTSSSM
jgi:uncharacterized membrane protein YdjX (TVP38/TMEM64 family)